MVSLLRFLFIGLLIVASQDFRAQGCSDAGACTIPALKPVSPETADGKNEFHFGISAGAADHSIFVLTPELGYSRRIGPSLRVDSKITYALHRGNGIATSGFGDFFLLAAYDWSSRLAITAGCKIPLSSADLEKDGLALPMDYQPGLGTLDFLAGVSFKTGEWTIAAGYQQPLTQNDNLFAPLDWPSESPLSEFIRTGRYERQGDVLLRVARSFHVSDHLDIQAGLLPIYHLGEDVDQSFFPERKIAGSDGFTLNANVYFLVKTEAGSLFNFSIGFPLVVRDTRPDGLTRSFVAGVEYVIR